MSATKQPKWVCVANIGDVDPLHGAAYVYVDKTCIYAPELERVEPLGDNFGCKYEVRRIVLERCWMIDGILSDNIYHLDKPVWFARDLDGVCTTMDITREDMIADLCGDCPVKRAFAYQAIADYHGWDNFDSYPRVITEGQVRRSYSRRKRI